MMNNKTRINFLVETKLKNAFEKEAEKSGLDVSSAMRLLMRDFKDGRIKVGTYPATVGFVDDDEQREIESELRQLSIDDLRPARTITV